MSNIQHQNYGKVAIEFKRVTNAALGIGFNTADFSPETVGVPLTVLI